MKYAWLYIWHVYKFYFWKWCKNKKHTAAAKRKMLLNEKCKCKCKFNTYLYAYNMTHIFVHFSMALLLLCFRCCSSDFAYRLTLSSFNEMFFNPYDEQNQMFSLSLFVFEKVRKEKHFHMFVSTSFWTCYCMKY